MLSERHPFPCRYGKMALLVLFGLHRRPPGRRTSRIPFGYGQGVIFLDACCGQLLIFSLVEVLASIAEEGSFIYHVREPRGRWKIRCGRTWTLAVAAIAEGYSLFVAYREFRNSASQDDGLWPAIHRSKDPKRFFFFLRSFSKTAAALLGIFGGISSVFFPWRVRCIVPYLRLVVASDRHRNHLDGNSSPPGE